MYYVYAIASQHRHYIYVGLTGDLKKRVIRHNSKFEKTTKPYSPFHLIYFELWPTRIEARQREKYFKNASGKRYLRLVRNRKYPMS